MNLFTDEPENTERGLDVPKDETSETPAPQVKKNLFTEMMSLHMLLF